ncbi:MAG: hypothetical protein N3A68_08190 [Bacteroidia bacterium]|jgi:hypothetical protein|nr:hypothetical protein [Bacteroidia bacterium]GIV22787.1 MAG: hypothetical protein KatS3mg025_0446 [Bacteroidia bacterium]
MRLSIGVIAVSVMLFLGALVGVYALHRENQALHAEVERLSHLVSERPVELSTFMTTYERFLTKLSLAGQAQNWPLAEFYHEELEETAEQLEKLNLTDDGIPVSTMMRPNLIEPLEAVKKAIEEKNPTAFDQSFKAVVQSCNNCHKAAGKPYIQFRMPEGTHPPQQIFTP